MNSENPLDHVYKAFSAASDCFRVVERAIRIQHEELFRRTQFYRLPSTATDVVLESAETQAADLAILALFATFERFVIEHLQMSNRLLAAGYPQQYSTKLAEKFETEVEYWKFGEVLDLFKGEIDRDLIGQVKQIKHYRDWIAHQNPNKPTPTQISPKVAFDTLGKMITQIRRTHVYQVAEDGANAAAPALVE
jgi:hypothetical protein